MCDRDESWANLNTYQTCLNYRGKMRYKNYSSKEKKKNLKQFIPHIIGNAFVNHQTQCPELTRQHRFPSPLKHS